MNPIDLMILEGIRSGQIQPRGGYTTDTTWGITFSSGRFSTFRYDDQYQEVTEVISEQAVLQTLEGSGLRRRMIEKHGLERVAAAAVLPESDQGRTLEQLEGSTWGEPNYPSHVVTECHRLRKIPVQDLTIEDLRLLIGQQKGLPWLVPLALAQLTTNPLAEGNYYAGDLLVAVLQIKAEYWHENPPARQYVEFVTRFALRLLKEHEDATVTRLVSEAWQRLNAERPVK